MVLTYSRISNDLVPYPSLAKNAACGFVIEFLDEVDNLVLKLNSYAHKFSKMCFLIRIERLKSIRFNVFL